MTQAGPRPHHRQWTTADGLRLVGDEVGDPGRPLVVLMHGGGQTRHSWAGTSAALARLGFRVISYDARGHGESGWSAAGDYSLRTRARDLTLVVADAAAPFALVGASLGGATALRAIADGMRPRALALVDIVPRPDPDGVARIRAFMRGYPQGFATLSEAADAIATYNPHRPRPRDTAGLRKNLRERDGRLYWHWDPRILADDADAEIAEFAGVMADLDAMDGISALLVRGASSDVVSDQGVTDLAQVIPHLEVATVAGAGHMVAGDRNDAFTAAIRGFLERHLGPGRSDTCCHSRHDTQEDTSR